MEEAKKIVMLKHPDKDIKEVEQVKWQLDRAIKTQVYLIANSPKYSKSKFAKCYSRTDRWIRSLDPKFYKEVIKVAD